MTPPDFVSLNGGSAGAFLIPADLAREIQEQCLVAREPHLISPEDVTETLYAMSPDGLTDFQIHLGHPSDAEPPPTWRDYLLCHEDVDPEDPDALLEWWRDKMGSADDEEVDIDLDAEIGGCAREYWDDLQDTNDGTAAQAYHALVKLDLDDGCGRRGDRPFARINLVQGDRPGSNLTYVEAPDLVALACLQYRLNELGTGFEITIDLWGSGPDGAE